MTNPQPTTKTGPTPLGIAILGLMILAILVMIVSIALRGSPKPVTDALRGEKKDYVGEWATRDSSLSADLEIDATGEISYDESAELRATRGQSGGYQADDLNITAFDGDDIVVGSAFRIKVTSKPHVVGDHFEMTANDVVFVRKD